MEGIFARRRALVIGGTGGIGRPVALGLARRGAFVTVTGGSSAERLGAVLAELKAASRETAAVRAGCPDCGPDSGQPAGFLCPIGGPGGLSPEAAARFILDKAGPPDILVIAWGPFKKGPLAAEKAENWRFLTENNLIFPGILISMAICAMINTGWGRILLFGGTNTEEIRGFSTTAAYSAAKTALGVVAKSAALTAGNAGITCNVVCPGLTDTEYTGPEDRDYNRRKSPGGRALTPEEIAQTALAVLENSALTGAIISAAGHYGFDKTFESV